jgi:hypothetical protein
MIEESARGSDVFILQPTCAPANDNLMELFILLDAFRRASAKRITVVMPYYGYARQDKKVKPREPITARLVADFIQMAGASRVVTLDLHADQIQGFFNIPVDHLYGGPILGQYFVDKGLANQDDVCVVAPDVGGVGQAELHGGLRRGFSLGLRREGRCSEQDGGKGQGRNQPGMTGPWRSPVADMDHDVSPSSLLKLGQIMPEG